MQVPEKQVLHNSLHLTKALAETDRRAGERLDEASLVLLSVQPEYEAFLTGIYDSVRSERQLSVIFSLIGQWKI